MNQFLDDVIKGLSASPKYLQSKYFYDKTGDELFQQIMHCEDYYLTRSELEIFQQQATQLADFFLQHLKTFDVWELGAGDATKSGHLLQALQQTQLNFTYYPVDISGNIIQLLQQDLPQRIHGLKVHGLQGEYLAMLSRANELSQRPKLVLFLGSTIGNIPLHETVNFLRGLRGKLNKGDMLMIGFDLVKNPHVIRRAYNDGDGITRRFNLNLLTRINRELQANFDLEKFDHYPSYDPGTGACKSYLVSLEEQRVRIGESWIEFCKDECIQTEVSQKYSVSQTAQLAQQSGFAAAGQFYDGKKYFLDAVWQAV